MGSRNWVDEAAIATQLVAQNHRTNPCRAGMPARHCGKNRWANMPTLRFALLPRAWCGKWPGIVALEQELKEMGSGN